MNNPYCSPDLDCWNRCEGCEANKAQLEFVDYFPRRRWVSRRTVDGLVQDAEDVHFEDFEACYREAHRLCVACAVRRYGGDYLVAIGVVDWTDDAVDEPDPAPDWSNDDREAWLRRRAERRELADRRRDDIVYGGDTFAHAPPKTYPKPRPA
jgi:hypothetical protein